MIAYPLFVKDPFFSIWSGTDTINGGETIFWTGDIKRTYGILKINDKSYCFLGDVPGMFKMEQLKVEVSLFRTTYHFNVQEAEMKVSFFSPLPLNDLKILSLPVCFMEYEIVPKQRIEDVTVYMSVSEDWCHGPSADREMRGDVISVDDGEIGYFGLNRQHIMNRSGDRVAADWGYYYIRAEECFYHEIPDFSHIEKNDTCDSENEEWKFLTGKNTHKNVLNSVKGKFIVAFDDVASINYFGRILKGYYLGKEGTIMDAIEYAYCKCDSIHDVCQKFEKKVLEDCKDYSREYQELLYYSYRQTVAAHKLVVDHDGTLLFISKECGSGGCLATVDVTYPTMPLLALYNPELLRASMEPIFKVASLPMWDYPFAPHDAGMYPYCCGQYYIVKVRKEGKHFRDVGFRGDWKQDVLPNYYLYPKASELYDIERQMPVEECANMILIAKLYTLTASSSDYLEDKLDYLKKWCDYLVEKGLVPEKQLCTDDFMEHLDKNVNLAIKSIIAIMSFADIAEHFGSEGNRYREVAQERAKELQGIYKGSHMPLSFGDENNSYSLKYNLLWDKLLGYDLFTKEALEQEERSCMEHIDKYGIPLDSRTKLTKTDWMMWMAALSDNSCFVEMIIQAINNYFHSEGAKGKPFPDLYDCVTGETKPFANRTVQGSMFILLLKDKLL